MIYHLFLFQNCRKLIKIISLDILNSSKVISKSSIFVIHINHKLFLEKKLFNVDKIKSPNPDEIDFYHIA